MDIRRLFRNELPEFKGFSERNIRLCCFIVIDLKTAPFKPDYAGKMNFYYANPGAASGNHSRDIDVVNIIFRN